MSKKPENKKKQSRKKIKEEIAEMLKSSIEKGKKDSNQSGLEKETEDNEEMDLSSDFRQFALQPNSESGSVALERVAREAPRPIFVGMIPRGGAFNEKEDEKVKYVDTGNASEEKKYFDSTGKVYESSEKIDFSESGKASKDDFSHVNSERFLVRSNEVPENNSQMQTFRHQRFNFEESGKQNKRDDRKYEYKPKRM